ncbi:NHL repeat-containing protein [Phytoactinopolyspora halotolerans]|uniref:Teneurin NHL domain-containing protein n=1 Tax=Phytoactinopolyspora halotolerans TaxID=1981512 RepID=A0A6L9SIX4_9ACTN|nr:NHL repeat-containing protein [Phytoactinopolyspora halotolerans]NEE04362.1 hypothetical protein [Phytoactinopolyspora halotolerans]
MTRAILFTLSSVAALLFGTATQGAVAAVPASSPVAAQPPAEPGPLETVAGTREEGHSGDGGPAVDAKLGEVRDVALDDAGNLYIATRTTSNEKGTYIRRVDPHGTISTVAGGLREDAESNDVEITPDGLAAVSGIATGPEGELYIADAYVGQVLRVEPGGGPAVVAGTGEYEYGGDGGPATSAQLESPVDVAVGDAGEIYIADAGGYIRRVDSEGIITTIAGTGEAEASSGDGGPAVEASFTRPMDVEVDAEGNIYVADLTRLNASEDDIPSHRIRRIDTDGVITTIAGGEECGYTGDGGPAADAELCFPYNMTTTADGTIYLSDTEHHVIRVISPDGTIDSLPTYVDEPTGMAVGPDGALYVGDGDRAQVHRIPLVGSAAGSDAPDTSAEAPDLWADSAPHAVTPVAGTGTDGSSGDGGPATDARLSRADDLAVGPDGTVYVLDDDSRSVRAIEPDGTMVTIAGGGDHGGSPRGPGPMAGDGRSATEAQLSMVHGIDVAPDGTLFMAGYSDGRVRKVSPAGLITTVAGIGIAPDEEDDAETGIDATYMAFGSPEDVAVAPDGSLYVSDSRLNQVFHIGLDGMVRVVAGTGTEGYSGDGGPATEAELDMPSRIDVGADGTLYILDSRERRIRAVTTDGVITTIAGSGSSAYDDPTEDVPATEVFLHVRDLVVDEAGTVYLGAGGSIRQIGPDGIITTLSDTHAAAVALDGHGNLYFSHGHQVSVLPRIHQDPAPASAENEEAGGGANSAPWILVSIGALLAAGTVGGYVLVRRRRSAQPLAAGGGG